MQLKKNTKLIINSILISLFIVLYILGSKNQFNFFSYFYPKNQIPLLLIVLVILIVGSLLIYNTYIGILYVILLIFQLKWIKYDTFLSEINSIPSTTNFLSGDTTYNPNRAVRSSEEETKQNLLVTPFYIDTQDERFRIDDVKVKEIIRQIQAELQFDPSKTPLARKVIIDIYRKYFDNDIFVKLNEITQESEKYQSEYQSIYQNPTVELGYDVDTAKVLQSSTAFGVTPIVDNGIGRGLRSTSS